MTARTDKIAILLNGPKYCGKDTAAKALMEAFGVAAEMFRFTIPVKDETHRHFGHDVAWDHFEDKAIKDVPRADLGGMSPRDAYIWMGDRLRAEHGPDIVTRMLCERIAASDKTVVINPDCGGDGEAEGIADELGVERVLVMRIHKAGHTYDGDSRDWVRSARLKKIDIVNVEDKVLDYVTTVEHISRMFVDSVRARDISPDFGVMAARVS